MCSASKQHSSTASHQRSQVSVVNEPPTNVSQDRLSFRSSGNCELHGVWIKGPIHLHSAQPHSWPLVIASATERHCGVCQSAEAYVLTPCHVPNIKRELLGTGFSKVSWCPPPPWKSLQRISSAAQLVSSSESAFRSLNQKSLPASQILH